MKLSDSRDRNKQAWDNCEEQLGTVANDLGEHAREQTLADPTDLF